MKDERLKGHEGVRHLCALCEIKLIFNLFLSLSKN